MWLQQFNFREHLQFQWARCRSLSHIWLIWPGNWLKTCMSFQCHFRYWSACRFDSKKKQKNARVQLVHEISITLQCCFVCQIIVHRIFDCDRLTAVNLWLWLLFFFGWSTNLNRQKSLNIVMLSNRNWLANCRYNTRAIYNMYRRYKNMCCIFRIACQAIIW